MFAHHEWRFSERILGLPETRGGEIRAADVEWQGNGDVIDVPGSDRALIPQGRAAHGIDAHRDEVEVRVGGKGILVEEAEAGIGRGDAASGDLKASGALPGLTQPVSFAPLYGEVPERSSMERLRNA